jgi:hypothetical protein
MPTLSQPCLFTNESGILNHRFRSFLFFARATRAEVIWLKEYCARQRKAGFA